MKNIFMTPLETQQFYFFSPGVVFLTLHCSSHAWKKTPMYSVGFMSEKHINNCTLRLLLLHNLFYVLHKPCNEFLNNASVDIHLASLYVFMEQGHAPSSVALLFMLFLSLSSADTSEWGPHALRRTGGSSPRVQRHAQVGDSL